MDPNPIPLGLGVAGGWQRGAFVDGVGSGRAVSRGPLESESCRRLGSVSPSGGPAPPARVGGGPWLLQGVRGGLTAWAGVPLPSGVSRCMQGRPPPPKKNQPSTSKTSLPCQGVHQHPAMPITGVSRLDQQRQEYPRPAAGPLRAVGGTWLHPPLAGGGEGWNGGRHGGGQEGAWRSPRTEGKIASFGANRALGRRRDFP